MTHFLSNNIDKTKNIMNANWGKLQVYDVLYMN